MPASWNISVVGRHPIAKDSKSWRTIFHRDRLASLDSCVDRSLRAEKCRSVQTFPRNAYHDQAFRFNNRNDMRDGDRFSLAVSQIVGKRLTWNQVIGKEGELRRGEG